MEKQRTTRGPFSFDEYAAAKHFPSLDGVRALSALMVITWHLHPRAWSWLSGYTGVTIFFVLSGYLITTLALREESKTGRVSLKAFYARRTFRILPVYYFVLGIYCLLIYVVNVPSFRPRHDSFSAALPYYLTYMGEYVSCGDAPFKLTWSLGIEEKFYLLWPLIGFVLFKRSTKMRIGFLTIFLVVSLLFGGGRAWDSLKLDCYSKIALGCLIAICLHERKVYERMCVAGNSACVVLASLSLVIVQLCLGTTPWLIHLYPFIVGLVLVGVLIGRSPVGSFLSSPILGYVGRRSYSIYLVHTLAINAVDIMLRVAHVGRLPSPIYFVIDTLTSIGMAEGLYRGLESRGIAVGRKLSGRILSTRP